MCEFTWSCHQCLQSTACNYFVPPGRPVGHAYCERVTQETFPYGPAARVTNPNGCRLIKDDDEVQVPVFVEVEGNATGGRVDDPRVQVAGVPKVERGPFPLGWMVCLMFFIAVIGAGE